MYIYCNLNINLSFILTYPVILKFSPVFFHIHCIRVLSILVSWIQYLNKYLEYVSEVVGGLYTSVFHILNMWSFFQSSQIGDWLMLDFNFNTYVIPLGIPISWLGSSVTGDIKVILRATSSFFIKLSVRGSTVKKSNWINNLKIYILLYSEHLYQTFSNMNKPQ